MSLPVALAFDDQSAHRTLEWFAAILGRAWNGTTGHCYHLQRVFNAFQNLFISVIEHEKMDYIAGIYLHYGKDIKMLSIQMQSEVFTGLQQTTPAHLMVKIIKGMPAGSNGTMEVKTQACFSISIIVVGFISGIHYCLIGLIRKRHDCITNSTRACQDGFISIPAPFLEKHLVISVW